MSVFYQELDALIRAGALAKAKDLLKTSRNRKFPSDELGKISLLARRVGMPEMALRLLSPVVRPQGRVKAQATAEHYTEYGGALIHVGSTLEGMKMLEGLKPPYPPQALLYWAFGCFSRWEYMKAIPRLREYVERPELTEYERAVGKANLAAAMVYERTEEAHDFVVGVIREFEEKKYDRLRLNMSISLCDISSSQGNYSEAREALKRALPSLNSTTSFDALFMEKWFALLNLMEKKPGADAEILKVREKAIQMRHWETIRNLDHHLMMVKKDEALLAKLYFGTPYPEMKKRFVKDFGGKWDPPESFDWRPSKAKHGSRLIDLSAPQELEKKISGLKAGQLPARLLSVLTSDLYRPFGIGALFAQVFPGDYYNYLSSPGCIHQLVKKTRKLVGDLGIIIVEKRGLYSAMESKVRMRIPRVWAPEERSQSMMAALERKFPAPTDFSTAEAARALDLNYWTVVKWLKEAVDTGVLDRSGAARATRYRFRESNLKLNVGG